MKKILLTLAAGLCLAACGSRDAEIAIVPYPNHLETGSGTFAVKGAAVVCDSGVDERTQRAVTEFAGRLALASGGENTVNVTAELPAEGIRFVVDASQPAEGYALEVTRNGAEVRAASFPGFFYAIQTMKQLLPAAVYGGEPAPAAAWELPCVKIADAPRFAYRGMHLDVARHFFSVEEVKRYIDMLSVHKLNRFHWHLTDDQGWRIEIKRYPRLTEVGSVRKATVVKKDWDTYDNTPYGGFYTQDEIREVVAYAADRAITVVPEIDLPGHMLAALTAYPELGCTGGPYDVWGRWGVADDVLCVGQEKTYEFLEGVLTEVLELFPSELIHIGGDECPKVRWEKCPRCQARIRQLGLKDADGHTAEHYLQSYVTNRIGKFLAERGRRIIGWDEILEGKVSEDVAVMSWRGSENGIEAAKLGHDVVMTPTSHFYFDYYQSLDTDNEPFGIGGYVPLEKVYSYDPAFGELTPEEQAHIIGVQANLWTEYIDDNGHLEYMLLPRLAALSEVQWCRPEVKDWNRFVGDFRMDRVYRAMGFEFAKHVFGVTGEYEVDSDKGCLVVTLSTQGEAPIHYTVDGSEPTAASPRYAKPVEITGSCMFRAAALRDNMKAPEYVREFEFNKATARPAVLNTAPRAKYVYGGAPSLVDGYRGGAVYANGAWVGWLDEPMDVTIDMGGKNTYASVELEVLVQKGEEVYPPSSVEVSVSDDGVNFTEAGRIEVPVEKAENPDGIRRYKVEFPATSARYLRVVALTVDPIPGSNGRKAHLFADEIVVE